MSKYTFTEGPRTVAAKRAKYRDEDGPKPSMGNSMNNLMFDRRVVRGNTFHGLGAGTSPASMAQKQKPRKRRKEPVSIFDLRPKLNRNEPVNLEAYLVEQTNPMTPVTITDSNTSPVTTQTSDNQSTHASTVTQQPYQAYQAY